MKETAGYAAIRGDDEKLRYFLTSIALRPGAGRGSAVRRVLFVWGAEAVAATFGAPKSEGKTEARGQAVRAGYCEAKHVQHD
ncbi:MAG: hypothetical protein ACFE0P_01115 [Oceanicaulis sp.]